jgi:HK97 family phage prohead protease
MTAVTHIDSPVAASFQVDEQRRTIRGLAVPYGTTAYSNGQEFAFAKGSLAFGDVSRVKVLIGHDFARAVGVTTALEETDQGLVMTARIAKGAAGDEALTMAAEGVWDGLSVGLGQGGTYEAHDGIQHPVGVPLREISLTPIPAFDDARLTSVTASAEGATTMSQIATEPDGQTAAPDTSADDDPQPQTFNVAGVLTGTVEQVEDAGAGLQATPGTTFAGSLTNPQGGGGRVVVSAGRPVTQVREESPYRFDGRAGAHSLIDDMRAAQHGDSVARQRFETFVKQTFAVTNSNVSALNPTENRPELYVPNLQFSRPLYELVSTGNIDDKTPFTVPKFSSASGLVGDHTEGTEPTPGAFAASAQTVTPAPLSGKIEIDREVLDQGGSPQADAIIWGEMLNAWFEAIEAKIAARLATTGTSELNLASAVDSALVGALTGYFAGLQFVRGGNRFTAFASDGKLFPALVSAADDAGRPLLPILGPANAQGSTGEGFDRVMVGNQEVRAAWALGATNASLSFNFVPTSVWCWTSPPQRFTFEYQLKSVDMAIWGYCATAILRDSDVKPIDYTTADS